MGKEVNDIITEAKKAWGALKDVWKKRGIYLEAKVRMYEGIIELSYPISTLPEHIHSPILLYRQN